MANDEPPYLTVGTDVSAKYKGAFCEAKIKKVNRVVKCKVTFKNSLGSFMVTDDLIKGSLRMGADIEAKHPEKNQFMEAVINKLQDYSQYTVVFDDGDETTLRRTSLCLKSGRHFAESPTLDQFPLTNPEHFGTPVIGAGKYKRKRRSTMNSSLDYESSDDDSFPRKLRAIRGKEKDPDLGKVVAVDYGDRRKKDSWYPGLIVPQSPAQSGIKITKDEHLIRSFKDGKYYQVPKRDTREFMKDNIPKIENNALKTAVDKAIQYLERDELPANWDKALFMGLELPSADEDSQDSDTDSSDDEPSEDKDRFVAQLYKFMDERGTPINKAPSVCNRDLNLYRLFKIMHKLGGFNKVTNQNKWKVVYLKMGLPPSNANGPNQIKGAYKRYLQSFEDFYRKLGCTMVNNSRSTRGRHRSDRSLSIITRTKERETSSPKGRNSKDSKDKALTEKKTEEKIRVSEKKEVKTEPEAPKPEEKSKSPEKKKVEKVPRAEEKDDKKKKDDKPRLVRSQSVNKDKKESITKEEDKKDVKPEKARTREDARKEKNESPEKKGTRSSIKLELERKEKEEPPKDKKDQSPKAKEKKEEKPKDIKEEKPKEKKEEKPVKERKIVKDKRVEEKTSKDKIEESPKEKKDEKPLREKRDSSKEPKEDKSKGRKEEMKPEEKSPVKKKLERVVKDKKEEKIFRPRRENKSPLPPENRKPEDSDIKKVKEEKPKIDIDVKKEDVKDKAGPKLRERREDIPLSEDEENAVEVDIFDEKDGSSQDGFEKKIGPGPRSKAEDNDESPCKSKRKSFKAMEKDDKDCEDFLSDSDDDTFEHDKDYKDLKSCEIELGDRVKVKYGRGRLKKVYDAKVLKIQTDGTENRYFVHYNGWNNRYDEWVRRNFIVALVNSSKLKSENCAKSPLQGTKKGIDKGRPPGPIVPSKPVRKNSTSSTNSSVSCSRATRSDKKSQQSLLSSGLGPKKRTRKRSGLVGLTDTSQDSDSDIEGTIDDEDENVGDADVEDNVNTQNDSCFKEELFSDDEEKEKLEDVKRDDITELEKAISVEDTAEDVKVTVFTPVNKDPVTVEVLAKEKTPNNEDLPKIAKETVVEDVKKEDCSLEMQADKEKTETESNIEKIIPVEINDKESKLQPPEKPLDIEKKLVPETSTVNEKSKIIKSGKVDISCPVPPIQDAEKSLFASVPAKIPPFVGDQNKKDNSSLSFTPSPIPLPPNKNILSFSGLQGLIQISSFDKNPILNPNRYATPIKDSSSKLEASIITLSTPPKIDLKPDAETRNLTSSLFRADKIMPVFGANSILSPPKLTTEPVKLDKSGIKNNQDFFSFMKGNDEKEKPKESKTFDSPFKTFPVEAKPDHKNENLKNLRSLDFDRKSQPTSFKHLISPAKFCAVKTDSTESKTDKGKDKFDFLVGSKVSDAKFNEIKNNIFSLSFPSITPKDKFPTDLPYSRSLALSAENLCCIKSKPSEQFDLSKTIPGIIERLKKDVVSDLKTTDSPPPQKEELSFNFLRGSQESGKSLSRSESSNSLRICEDLSDTNDSNTDSKDLICSEKVEPPSVLSSNSASDNAVSCPSENFIKHPDTSKPHTLAVVSSQGVSEKKDDVKNSFKTSVITVAITKPAPSIPVITPVDVKNKDLTLSDSSSVSEKPDVVEKKIEPFPVSLKVEASKVESTLETKDSDLKSHQSPQKIDDKDAKSESITISKNEPSIVAIKSEKDSLFDDLLKIKSTNTTLNQSSVIMWNSETKSTGSVEEKNLGINELKDVNVKVDIADTQVKEQSLLCKESILDSDNVESKVADETEKDLDSNVNEIKSEPEDNENNEDDSGFSMLSKKEVKKKKLGKKLKKLCPDGEREDKEPKIKDGKGKSKKRLRLENEDSEKSRDPEMKIKSKKFKKNKNKKRLSKHEDLLGEHKKGDMEDDHKDISEKMKRKEKRKNDKKFLKSSMKGDFETRLELKKKKGKKNKDKLNGEKKDFLEKKTKKKKKLHIEDNQDTDSEKESTYKTLEKKKKKDRKKFKTKDSSSSDDAGDKYFKEQSKILNLPSSSSLMRQDSKSDDPDMSFLLCEEKVPASPVGIGNMADDTSGSSSIDENGMQSAMDILPLPNELPGIDNIESSDTMNKHGIDTSAVLDNTPPTTPSSTESLLSSSPSHERDSFSMNYPESTQSGRDSGEGESDLYRVNANRTISRGSEEYSAATTLAFAVGKSVPEKPKEEPSHSFLKRQKSEIEDHSPSKRKKKSKRVRRCSEPGKSPRHKPSLSRLPKVDSYCEDSSGASPAASSSPPYSNTSTMSFSRSPHRMSCSAEALSRYNFYVPLHEKDPEKRIALLQDKMAALKKEYLALRAKVIAIDHKRRRARKKIREAGAANANPSAQSEDGQSCS